MSLLQDYSQDFDSGLQKRGEEYQRGGAVHIIDHGSDFVEAEVQGSHLYRTVVERKGDVASTYSCTCPYFDDQGICKHCWALVVEASKRGVLPGMPPLPDVDDGNTEASLESRSGREDQLTVDDIEDEADEDDAVPRQPPLTVHFGGISGTPATHVLKSMQQGVRGRSAERHPSAQKNEDSWKSQLKRLSDSMRASPNYAPKPLSWPAGRRLLYVIRAKDVLEDGLSIALMQETPKREGMYDRPRQLRINQSNVSQLPDAEDRRIIQLLTGAGRSSYGYYYDNPLDEAFEVDESAYEDVLRMVCQTSRCRLLTNDNGPFIPISWDEGPPWEFFLEVRSSPGGRYLVLDGLLRRPKPAPAAVDTAAEEVVAAAQSNGSAAAAPVAAPTPEFESIPLSEPHLLLHAVRDGFVFIGNHVSRLKDFDAFPLIVALREGEKISVPLDKQIELLKMLMKFPRLPRLELPPELEITEVAPIPRPRVKLSSPDRGNAAKDPLIAKVTFDYDGVILDSTDNHGAVVTDDGKRLLRRDAQREATYAAELAALGFREEVSYFNNKREIRLPVAKMPKAVAELTRRGWTVEADGKLYRSAGQVNVSVSSGIDWFELHGDVSFDGGMRASLPRLLEALRKGENVVRLDDGTFGLLPEEWLRKYAGLAGLGESEGDTIKFSSRQIGFLDALLSSMPEARFDETFSRARDELMRFSGIEAIDPPTTFQGTLRQYQREGLGWMAFLRKFGFGGILADDMGLGKTVQVLALLDARRRLGANTAAAAQPAEGQVIAEGGGDATNGSVALEKPPMPGPSLVVAPRSLIFNWKAEATKFSPLLKVLDHTAVDRPRSADHFKDYDIVLTTYGTLRRDMSYFRDIRFDYAILDEAQAIKNASSESAKAARLLQADHRLALSGTPVQNHLGELWSLFDFLNAGMMGSVGVFRELSADAANKDLTSRELLARALRPFILRRTKEQVASDLPEKLEQTIYCELEKEQRKLYNELRDHYRTSLLDRVAREGMNKAKIMVLEALLRLRQAACHPGLIDKKRSGEPSAKLEALMEHLGEVVEEGHKVLVFSQFTSLLAIVKDRLDKQNITYEYLDGRTKDRQARVDRFQTDEACKLFLISLKAGGIGLNLTAAEYVFLLDPWWNPAVEAQAIDRAHRIGQTKAVFAYRLIAKETVEEKVLQLQQSKKDLADAIINADNSLIRSLNRDDLEMLLS